MPFRWSRRAVQTISTGAMSALLLTSAMKHFREPRFFAQVVPDYLCRDAPDTNSKAPAAGADSAGGVNTPHDGGGRPLAVMTRVEWIALSGLLEAGAAVVLLIPAARRVAATAITGMLTVFLAGHVDALRRAHGPTGTASQRKAHTLRLPLQVPLILWAWSLRDAPSRPHR